MRTPEQHQQLERVINARLTTAPNDGVFLRKAARENGWSTSFTCLAIREYRRFLFLALAAGHPVSPSDVVDQVWHLHILHTRDYWDVFCPEIFGRPFHHQPNRGGEAEQTKLRDWYSATLESYERLLGETPSAEIWPPLPLKIQIDHRVHRRVDTSENWVIPKPQFVLKFASNLRNLPYFLPLPPRLRPRLAALFLLLTVIPFATGCNAYPPGNHPLWNLEGPKFLALFIPILLIAWTLAFTIRSRARQAKPPADLAPPNLETDELAYLADGPRRLTQSLVARLAAAGVITIEEKKREVCQVAPLPPDASPLERAVYDRASGLPYKELQDQLTLAFDPVREKLTALGLLLTPPERKHAILTPALIAFVPLLLGVIKLIYGVTAGKPVGYLLALCFAALFAFLLCYLPLFRSRKGDTVLEHFQQQFAPLQTTLRTIRPADHTDLYAAAIALYGTAILTGTPLDHLHNRLGPESTGAGSGCGAGCSSGGGDGGGCGGGCGGCGGCG